MCRWPHIEFLPFWLIHGRFKWEKVTLILNHDQCCHCWIARDLERGLFEKPEKPPPQKNNNEKFSLGMADNCVFFLKTSASNAKEKRHNQKQWEEKWAKVCDAWRHKRAHTETNANPNLSSSVHRLKIPRHCERGNKVCHIYIHIDICPLLQVMFIYFHKVPPMFSEFYLEKYPNRKNGTNVDWESWYFRKMKFGTWNCGQNLGNSWESRNEITALSRFFLVFKTWIIRDKGFNGKSWKKNS